MSTRQVQQRNGKPIIAQYLERYKDQIAAALPKHIDADRMARIALTECRRVPRLLEADPRSLFGAIIQASQLGLEPGGVLGQAYLIPYWNKHRKCYEVQFMPGYQGLIELAYRSGMVVSVSVGAVYEGDDLDYAKGLTERLEHKPAFKTRDSKKLTHAYAIFRLKGGGTVWDIMPREVIEAHRQRSQAKDNGPWITDYEPMAIKTVVRALCKFIPKSPEINSALMMERMAEAGESQNNSQIIEGEWEPGPLDDSPEAEEMPEPPKSKTESVKARLREAEHPPQPEPAPDATAPEVTYDELATQIKEAETDDELNDALALAGALSDAEADGLETLANERRTALEAA
jgi:recombination protein RecT